MLPTARVANDNQAGSGLRVFAGCGVVYLCRIGTPTTHNHTLSLPDALPICRVAQRSLHVKAAVAKEVGSWRELEARIGLGERDEVAAIDRRHAVVLIERADV